MEQNNLWIAACANNSYRELANNSYRELANNSYRELAKKCVAMPDARGTGT